MNEILEPYGSGDIESSKSALLRSIEFTKEEISNRGDHSAFDWELALAYARLAWIAEYKGKKDEAKRLFSLASEHEFKSDVLYRERIKNNPNVISTDEHPRTKGYSIEDWYSILDEVDSRYQSKWTKPNQAAHTTPASAPR
ncbi:hypothetical protein [Pelagicoccus albus]